MRSAPTLTNRRQKLPLPRLLRLPLSRSATPRWSPSASQPQDTDTTATDTTTARRLPRRLATMSPLLPPPSPQLRLPTLSQSRPVSTSQSLSQESAVRTSLRRNASPSLLPLLARLLSSPSPSRSARRPTMDMQRTLTMLSQSLMPQLSPSPMPLLLMPDKMVILDMISVML